VFAQIIKKAQYNKQYKEHKRKIFKIREKYMFF